MLKILAVIGIVLLALLLLLVVALVPRARVDFARDENGTLHLTVAYGRLRLTPLPRPKKKKPSEAASAQKPKKPKKPKPEKEKKPSRFSFKNVDIGDVIYLVLDLIYEFRHRLVIHILRVDAMLATGDAAKTGILLGRVAAVSGMILPFLEQNYTIPDLHIHVDGDFEGEKTTWSAALALSIRPIHMPLMIWKFRKKFYRLYKDLTKKEN